MRRRKTARYNLPKINLPGIKLPKVKLPKVDLPHPNLPEFHLPQVHLPMRQILLVAALVVLVLAMINLNARLADYSRLSSERDSLRGDVSKLQVTADGLQTQLAYAKSDKAAEEYARDSHMVRDGEKLVVVMTPQVNVIATPVSQTAREKAAQNWEVWWALFFGKQ